MYLFYVFQHHSYRTFLGLTCLVQISTRTQDFLLDALELRHHLHMLNAVFTDPNIVKVGQSHVDNTSSCVQWFEII